MNKQILALVGNMNVGKTTLFNQLCRHRTNSVNHPGTTITITKGSVRGSKVEILDTPGSCSIFSPNEDERVSRDVLLSLDTPENIDGGILVADAKKLKRSIALALQYAEYDLPMVFDLNMIDEIDQFGIEIDTKRLSEILDVEVCSTVATEGQGIEQLKSALKRLRPPKKQVKYPKQVEEFCHIASKLLSNGIKIPKGILLLLLVGENSSENYIADKFGAGMVEQIREIATEFRANQKIPFEQLITNLYFEKADQIIAEVQKTTPKPHNRLLERFGEWCLTFKFGIPIAITIIALMFIFVGSFGATLAVDTINSYFFEGFLLPEMAVLLEYLPYPFIKDLLIDPDFGVLPTGIFLAIGIVAPVLFCFYTFFGFLEESGYLPRISILLDKTFTKIGLNGKGVLPIIMGFSCITMAILTTRMLDSKREKNIATFLLMLGIPCAPLLAVIFIILHGMPASAALTVFGIMGAQVFIAGLLLNKIIPGNRSPLLIEIPPMRFPSPIRIVRNATIRTYFFMKEAVPLFIFASVLIFLFDRFGGLTLLEQALEPVTKGLLGLPEKSVQVFLKLIIRRENGAAELQHLREGYTNLQLVVNILMMTLVPCINAVFVLVKERGTKIALIMTALVIGYMIVLGTSVNHICLALGITFSA